MSGGTARSGITLGPHLLVFSIGYVVFSYASVPDAVMTRFDAGFAEVGLLISAALGAFVLVQTVGGRVVDDRATLPVLLALGAGHAVLAVGIDLAPTYGSLFALRAVWGLVGGLGVTVGATQLSRAHDGTAATRHEGIYGGALTGGGAVAFLVSPAVVSYTGWFGVHAVGGLAAVPALATLLATRDRTATTAPDAGGVADDRAPGSDREDGTGTPLCNPLVLLAAGCYLATLGAYVTLSTFVTAYFADLGVTAPLNALALFVASLGRAVGGFSVAHPSVDDGRLIAATTGVGAAGLVALAFGDGALLLVLPLVVLGAVSLPFGGIFKVAAAATRRDGTALAIVMGVGNVGALTLPAVTGWLREATGGYAAAFLLLGALTAAAALGGAAIARRERAPEPEPAAQ